MTTFRPGDRVHLKGHAHTPATTGTVITENPTAVYVMWDDNYATSKHHPQHLEPAGEPMADHFESQTSSTSVTVDRDPSGARVGIMRGGETKHAFTVTPGTAPAFVQAILEAAGVEPLSEHYGDDTLPATSLSRAAHYLSVYANQVNAAAKEAADREALEVEAYALYRASCLACDTTPAPDWATAKVLTDYVERDFMAIALTARTLHGVTK